MEQGDRFAGWTDVGLNETGIREAVEAGRILRREGHVFDVAFTSAGLISQKL